MIQNLRVQDDFFENVKPEELLQFLKIPKKDIDRTGISAAAGGINFICTLLCGEALWEFDKMVIHNNDSTNTHLKEIQEGLLEYFFPTNALSKQKRSICITMNKNRMIPMSTRRLSACLMDLEKYLLSFPGSNDSNKTDEGDINEILLNAVHNGWAKQAYLQGWDFEERSYRET